MKKTLLSLLAMVPLAASATQYWVPGVTLENHAWKDVDKLMTDDHKTGDSVLCWAAAASNVVAWWQDYNAGHLVNHKEGIPQGEQALFNAINDAFVNTGADGYLGLSWFMDGATDMLNEVWFEDEEIGTVTLGDMILDSDRTEQGGYYNGIVQNITSTMSYESQFIRDEETGMKIEGVLTLTEFTQKLVDAVSTGGVVLGLSADYGDHAITLWGVDVADDTHQITRMWVTDSDDKNSAVFKTDLDLIELICTPTSKHRDLGHGQSLDYDAYSIVAKDGLWYTGDQNEYIDSFSWLSANVQWTVPEPATGTLGLVALAGLAARRRRK